MADWNADVIEEFRNNEGIVGGVFDGRPLLLLHTTGAKSGAQRVHPLMYQDLGGSFAVFASKGGAPSHPAWYHNVVANPDVVVEVGTHTLPATARIVTGAERDTIWSRQKREYTFFADYEAKADRVIPVVVLQPK